VSAALEVRPTIDRRWLEQAAAEDPLPHAYALWDLERTPQAVRFASAVRGDETVGYLLVWLGRGGRPVVHWYGPPALAEVLLPEFPPPPFLAVVPPELSPAVAARYPGARTTPLRLMLRARAPLAAPLADVRRLHRDDQAHLRALARGRGDADLRAYDDLDPEFEPAWGAFDGERLVGVARAAVRLPHLWVVGGVYVEPEWRARGLGRALVGSLVLEAGRSGAGVGLYAREDPGPALRLYEGLGFRSVGLRAWWEVIAPSLP